MRLFTERNFARASAFASIVLLGALGPYNLYSSSPLDNDTQRLLIQGSDVDSLVSLVEGIGGTVNQELSVLKAVGVEVTQSQLNLISRSALVHRILEDRQVALNSVEACGIIAEHRLHREKGGQLVWNFSNRKETPATLESISVSWPEELGDLKALAYGDQVLASNVSGSALDLAAKVLADMNLSTLGTDAVP